MSDKVSLDLEGPRTLEITNLKGEREVIRTYGAVWTNPDTRFPNRTR